MPYHATGAGPHRAPGSESRCSPESDPCRASLHLRSTPREGRAVPVLVLAESTPDVAPELAVDLLTIRVLADGSYRFRVPGSTTFEPTLDDRWRERIGWEWGDGSETPDARPGTTLGVSPDRSAGSDRAPSPDPSALGERTIPLGGPASAVLHASPGGLEADGATVPVDAPSVPKRRGVLRVLDAPTELSFVLPIEEGRRWVVGRDPGQCDAVLTEDGHVSRTHAAIVREAGRYFVADLGSRWKTHINGQELTRPRELHDGDVLRIGKTRLEYRVGSEGRP